MTSTIPPTLPRPGRWSAGRHLAVWVATGVAAGLGGLAVAGQTTGAQRTGSEVGVRPVAQQVRLAADTGPGMAPATAPTVTPPLIVPTFPQVGPSAGPPTFDLPPIPTPPSPSATPSAGPPASAGGPGPPSGPVVIDPADPGQPATDPAPTDGAGTGDAPEKKPGRFDIPGQIRYAINNWFRGLATSALNPILDLLGRTVLATPDVTRSGRVAGIWSMTARIANTVFVLFVVAGGAIVMSHETLQTRSTLKDVAPRLVVAFILANASLSVVHEGIGIANALSGAFLGEGLSPAATADTLRIMLLEPIQTGGIFLILLGLVTVVLAVLLLATYIIRIALTVLLVAVAPLVLTTHALEQTDGLARLWWRAVAGCFGIQIAQSQTLIVALRVFFNNGTGNQTLGLTQGGALVNLLIACCLLYILIRIPVWVARLVLAGSRVHRPSVLVRQARYAVLYQHWP